MESAIEFAGFILAHAVWCVSEGETLIPLLAVQKADGKQRVWRLDKSPAEQAVQEGRLWLKDNPESVALAILVYDGYIPLPSGKKDALIAEVPFYGSETKPLTILLPYRHAKSIKGFAVHKPKFVWNSADANRDAVADGQAFFQGAHSHEHGGAIWEKHLDESL